MRYVGMRPACLALDANPVTDAYNDERAEAEQICTSSQGTTTGLSEVLDRAAVRLSNVTLPKVLLEGLRPGVATLNPSRSLSRTEYGRYSPLTWPVFRAMTGPTALELPPSLLTLVSEAGFCPAESHAIEIVMERFKTLQLIEYSSLAMSRPVSQAKEYSCSLTQGWGLAQISQ